MPCLLDTAWNRCGDNIQPKNERIAPMNAYTTRPPLNCVPLLNKLHNVLTYELCKSIDGSHKFLSFKMPSLHKFRLEKHTNTITQLHKKKEKNRIRK